MAVQARSMTVEEFEAFADLPENSEKIFNGIMRLLPFPIAMGKGLGDGDEYA